MKILIILLFVVVLIGLAMSVQGLARPPEPAQYSAVQFSDQVGTFNKLCTEEITTCATDADCQSLCKEQQRGMNMACVQIADPSDKSGQLPKSKVCAPREAIMKCGKNLGGVLTWSGWANPDRMEWNCLCQFPSYASNDNCSQFNSGICSAYNATQNKFVSGYNWNVSMGRPEWGSCTCPTGFTRQTSLSNQIQRCVPNEISGLYADLQTASGYTYIGCFTGVSGTRITVTGIQDALSKAGSSPFFAIAGTAMLTFQSIGNAVSSKDPVCLRICEDNAFYRCGGKNSQDVEIWAVYKKN
jgi:hypothetical protein